ncbi:hypothetical protein A5702_05830 [Mycobacterium sp. E3339]|nr:hypothetical protein A5702_05830 [Mycobacterium sp. E3339]
MLEHAAGQQDAEQQGGQGQQEPACDPLPVHQPAQQGHEGDLGVDEDGREPRSHFRDGLRPQQHVAGEQRATQRGR